MASKTATLVYRNNDLFEMLIPKIIEVLESKDCEVKLMVVPKDTDDVETDRIVSTWYAKERPMTNVFSDKTCHLIMEDEYGGQLDSIASHCVASVFLGVDQVTDYLEKQRDSQEESKRIFQKAIRATGDKVGPPVVVKIMTDNLTDHQPFVNYERGREPYAIRMSTSEAVDLLQSWVREIFPDCKFDCQEYTAQATWYIVDRHARVEAEYQANSGEGYPIVKFRLPVENTVFDLAGLGLLPPVTEITEQMVAT